MNRIQEAKASIRQAVLDALARAIAQGDIPDVPTPVFSIDAPRDRKNGDFAVNIAMILAKPTGMNPRDIAGMIAGLIESDPTWLDKLDIAGPGFLNFYLPFTYFHHVLGAITKEAGTYGRSDAGGGRKVQIEFVSANPTGLLHMGNARGASLGDSLANIMQAAGYEVSREYFINDAGNQIENFGKSVEARYLELLGETVEFPEDGYHGEDIIDTARALLEREGDRWLKVEPEERKAYMIKVGLEEKLRFIRQSLEAFGVYYDVWFSEKSLHDGGKITETVEQMRAKNLLYESEGALWLKATAFGEEKDEVMIRSNGAPTYFAGDIAYHRDKFERGFEELIDIWGADHHGHVARMKAAMGSLGYDASALEIILYQLVNLVQNGEVVRMSKRSGQYITLDELVEDVGKDAVRFFFIMRSSDSQMDFDLDLAKAQSSENPVYYVQYAHARIHSLLKLALAAEADGTVAMADLADTATEGDGAAEAADTAAENDGARPWLDGDIQLLTHPAEKELIRKLAELPEEIIQAAADREPHRLPRYALDLAGLYHSFYTECRCLVDERELRNARLLLCDATRIVLRDVLTLIGVSAPERM